MILLAATANLFSALGLFGIIVSLVMVELGLRGAGGSYRKLASSFSNIFRIGLSTLLRDPSSLVISLRLFMSDPSKVRVSNMLRRNADMKIARPMISFIQLLKLS
jgi:hypothetical protein